MYTKLLKLTNGENLIVSTDSNCNDFKNEKSISVIDPVLISTLKFNSGSYIIETYTMQPWIKIAKKDIINIPTESIIVAVDIQDDVEEQYKKFLSKDEGSEVMISDEEEVNDMIDQLLEDEYEGEELEEIDDDKPRSTKYTTTVH